MKVEEYFQKGVKSDFVSFFGNSKRLQLLNPVHAIVISLTQELNRPLNILDVGAGTGMHAAHLAQMEHKVTAVDPVEDMLKEGEKLYSHPNLTFTVDSLPNLTTLGSARYDLIYSIAAWQYIKVEDRQKAMERSIGLLRPGGFLVINWPIPMSRELQYPLSDEEIAESIKEINKKLPEHNHLEISPVNPIPDPDGRFGCVEKTKLVHFHTMIIKSPGLELSEKYNNKMAQ